MARRTKPRTAWKPGQSGNPEGGKLTQALRQSLNDWDTDEGGNPIHEEGPDGKLNKVKRIRRVADALVKKAMKGDVQAIAECFNRIDGKVAQALDVKSESVVTLQSEAVSRFDAWLAEVGAAAANGHDTDVGAERPVLPDSVPPGTSRH